MSTLYHWETTQILGRWEQVQSKWWIVVDCVKAGIADPAMLEGRCVTVKGQRKRLGALAANARPGAAYFRPWEIADHLPDGELGDALRGLWLITDARERDKALYKLRVWLKDVAARERMWRPIDAAAPSIRGWQRWALEPLDWVLCQQGATGQWPLPPNQMEYTHPAGLAQLWAIFNTKGGYYGD